MTSTTDRLETKDGTFAELGTITHEGRDFTALGATEDATGERLYAYDYKDRVANWDGSVTFGKVIRRRMFKQWSPFGFGGWHEMQSIRIRRPDGSEMVGRHSGMGFVRLRRVGVKA